MQLLPDGTYSIDDAVSIDGEGISPFVFCAGWLLEILKIESGEFYFLRDGEPVRPDSKRFGIFYPPFSIVRTYVRDLNGWNRGIGAVTLLPGLPKQPVIFETKFKGPFTGASQAAEIIAAGTNVQSIEPNTKLSLLSVRAKRLIDENYLAFPSIAKVAERINVSHAHLSRQFRRDFDMTPSEYLHQLRVADATYRLSLGEPIIDISHDVGYNDLSRFYKQFRKKTTTSPANCRTILEKRT
jgi:AraC-like DNA-binding protein